MDLKRFTSSDKSLLEKAFEIRNQVFIIEQKVDEEEEFDRWDYESIHYLVLDNDKAVGTSRWRITKSGIKLERFAVLKEYRGKGIGQIMLRKMIEEVPDGYEIYMHAQVSVLPFYEKEGFRSTGPMFSECDIDHYKMIYKSVEHTLTLSETIDFVKDFHNSFGLYVGENPTAHVKDELIQLRHRLMHEENEEYLNAAQNNDLVEVADALGDMLYILCGTILTHGMQYKIEEVYREIQRSNMSKLDKDGKPIYREDGKVLKSDLYFKPDIKSILFGN